MAATQSRPPPDPISEDKLVEPDSRKERPIPAKNEASVTPNSSADAATTGQQRDSIGQFSPLGSAGDLTVYPPNIYAPQAQAFYYRGYENAIGEWDDYHPYVNAEGLKIGSPGVYNENGSLLFHAGYAYGPQVPYGPYSPVTTPVPSVSGDGQLYSPQQFPFSGSPYYQQFGLPNSPYMTPTTAVPQPDLSMLGSIDQQGNNMVFGPSPSYSPVLGSFGRDSLPRNLGAPGFHDLPQGFDGFRSGGLWSDWSKPSDRHRPWTSLSPTVSPQPIGTFGSYGQNAGMASQQQRSSYSMGSGSNSYTRGYTHSGFNQGSGFGTAPISSVWTNNRSWLPSEISRWQGRPGFSVCGCNGSLDILSEQNRGPRASKPKNQSTAELTSAVDHNKCSKSSATIHIESYNRPDFVTEYKDAKFFVIKSYSEDNVHKSIKYGVWASTPNGNRKLDAAYREAKEKQEPCPVLLFFSVNASAQFCGVAEMVGAVDFDSSVDYWQQDKWSGRFPVKWHIIKDVPNSQFRHIVLENNDNKPVTNSRDTQEVKLEQGIEMLNILRKYENEMSILDDFEFYEERQKAMQERKTRQQGNPISAVDFTKQLPKSFAQVVRLDEGNKQVAVSVSDSFSGRSSIGEDTILAVSSGN
ncbi:YTH domain-containing protein ECT1 isoform X2 [Mercurialis annua]|uniref:YTH domain-containing protein ECT1 isoform X2 n=1 Tax=Mercurialis annua TaxID=3986 RepID=UPI00215FE91F|nr:YTH domain-containing protein ECT1 isoform X2 [Mercurialis annua]